MFGKDYWSGRYGRLFFDTDDGGGNGGTESKPGETKPADPFDGLPDDVKAAVEKRINAAAKAARSDGEKAGLSKAEQAAAEKAATEKAAKEEADALAKGEFDKAKASYETKIKATESERDELKGKLERAEKRLQAVVDAGKAALEATKDKDLIDGFPGDADLLAQAEWLDDPRTKAAMKVATESAKVATAKEQPKVPKTPPPDNGAGQLDLSTTTAARWARNYTG